MIIYDQYGRPKPVEPRYEEPVVSTQLVRTYPRRPYHPSMAPIQPSPPPTPVTPRPTLPQQGLRWGVEREQIQMFRERAREYPERVWRPPIQVRGRQATRAFIEEKLVPPHKKPPRTVTALERFRMLEERLAQIPGITRFTSRGWREEKPLVEAVQPLKFPLGVVAPIESLARPEVPTPVGAVLSPRQRGQLVQEGPFYVAGTLLGEYVVGVGAAKALGTVWGGVKRVTPQFIKQPLAQWAHFGWPARAAHRIRLWRITHLPTWRGSRLDIWLGGRRAIARGEVAGRIGGWETATAFERIGDISLRGVSVPKAAFEFTLAPRTGGVFVRGFGPLLEVGPQKVLPYTMILGQRIVTWKQYPASWQAKPATLIEGAEKGPLSFRRYTWRMGKVTPTYFERGIYPTTTELAERGLLPFVTQAQVTRMGIHPYIPRAVVGTFATAGRGVAQFFAGLAATALLRARPEQPSPPKPYAPPITPLRFWHPTFAYRRERYTPLTVPTLEPREKEKAVPVPIVTPTPLITEVPKEPLPVIQVPRIPTPTPTIPERPIPYRPWWPRRGGGRDWPRRDKPRFGAWFYREHPIPMPREFRLRLLGERRKRKKKKSKQRRRKR